MRDKLTVVQTSWKRHALDSASEPAGSPFRRPYSPYPYRDLPKTPSEWGPAAHPRTQRPAAPAHDGSFHLFSYLPAELRLQIWREALLSASEHGRVHRIRLAVTDASGPDSDALHHRGPRIEILPTPQLSESTHSTRSLLTTCSEARHEALTSFVTLPDSLPLAGGGVLRCDLSRDVLLLSDVSSDILLSLSDLHCHRPPSNPLLASTRHLGLDLAPLLQETAGCSYLDPAAAIPPELETALVTLTASFPRLEQVYLLQATAVVDDPESLVIPVPEEHVFLGRDAAAPISASSTATTAALAAQPRNREWYTTRPFPSYRVTDGYYTHLTQLMRFLCQFRQALDAPAVLTEWMEEAGLVERLERVWVRVLGHYVASSSSSAGDGGLARGDGEEEWLLSSPEKCLEVALGREPRWVQWEWVCQCLDA